MRQAFFHDTHTTHQQANPSDLEQFNLSCSLYAYRGFGWQHQIRSRYFNIAVGIFFASGVLTTA